jgi:hypothetical protein
MSCIIDVTWLADSQTLVLRHDGAKRRWKYLHTFCVDLGLFRIEFGTRRVVFLKIFDLILPRLGASRSIAVALECVMRTYWLWKRETETTGLLLSFGECSIGGRKIEPRWLDFVNWRSRFPSGTFSGSGRGVFPDIANKKTRWRYFCWSELVCRLAMVATPILSMLLGLPNGV